MYLHPITALFVVATVCRGIDFIERCCLVLRLHTAIEIEKKTILRNGPVWKQLLFVVVPSLNLNTCLFSYIPILLTSSLENKG